MGLMAYPTICISALWVVERVPKKTVGFETIFLGLRCEAQKGNGTQMLIVMMDAIFVSKLVNAYGGFTWNSPRSRMPYGHSAVTLQLLEAE